MTRSSCEFWRDAAIRHLYAAQSVWLSYVENHNYNYQAIVKEHHEELDEAAKCMVASYHCFNHPQSFGI